MSKRQSTARSRIETIYGPPNTTPRIDPGLCFKWIKDCPTSMPSVLYVRVSRPDREWTVEHMISVRRKKSPVNARDTRSISTIRTAARALQTIDNHAPSLCERRKRRRGQSGLALERFTGSRDSACHTDKPRFAPTSLTPVLVRVPAQQGFALLHRRDTWPSFVPLFGHVTRRLHTLGKKGH
jgi:hypothetical protein